MAYDIENPGPGMGQAQKCGGVKPFNGIPNPLSIPGSKGLHTITKMNNNIYTWRVQDQ